MVIKFVRDQYPQARFQRIYDANTDGWKNTDFHRCCDKKGWTLTVVETTKGFIFGGFTTIDWKSPIGWVYKCNSPHTFLFSVNEGSKYPITGGDKVAVVYNRDYCAMFGGGDLVIHSESNKNTHSGCYARSASFMMPGILYPLMNGGEEHFQLKQFEVYSVTVRVTINIISRSNEGRERVRVTVGDSFIF